MSQQIFPTFQGLSWDYSKKTKWSNIIQTATSGQETRIKLWSYPIYEISISYNFLTNNSYAGPLNSGDIEKLIGFYNVVGGTFDDFLYRDPIDNKISTPQSIGTGNGVETKFQLIRSFGTWVEPIFAVNGTPKIFIAGIETHAFTLNDFGLITFTSAPVGAITWTGDYYFRCRFKEDNIEFKQMFKYFHTGTIDLISVKL